MNDWDEHILESYEDVGEDEVSKRIAYLEFLRNTVFKKHPHLKTVQCHRYPELGELSREDIDGLLALALDEEGTMANGDEIDFRLVAGGEQRYPNMRYRRDGATVFYEAKTIDEEELRKRAQEAEMGFELDEEFYRQQADQMLARAEMLKGIPNNDDAFVEGTVLTFEKRYATDVREFLYAAIKAGDVWYVTGKVATHFNWSQLMRFVGLERLNTIKVLSRSEPLKDYVARVTAELEAEDPDLVENK